MSKEIVDRCEFHKGELVDGKYYVNRILGEGSFGKVFQVTDPGGEIFALKLLKLWEVPSEIRQSLVQRFDMEFQTGQIESDYLVRSLSYGLVKGNPYILMEYCPGGDLGQYLGSNDISISHISREILTGLSHLHTYGKVHRDLKPENVLFKQNRKAALTDFGISGDRNKRMTERNIFGKPQQIFGTYAYMPPEQVNRARGEATVLPTTDIFSFGVMLFHLLTGELPFGELDNHNDLVTYQRNGKEGKWNRNLIVRLPEGEAWLKVIDACLIPDFKQRAQAAQEVINLLPGSTHNAYIPKPEPIKNSKNIQLRIMQGEEFGKIYSLSELTSGRKRMCTMGRMEGNDLFIKEIQSAYISRYHCTIETTSDYSHWFIRDGQWRPSERCWMESTNGTYVNSTEVTPDGLEFHVGDILSIGDVKIRVEAI